MSGRTQTDLVLGTAGHIDHGKSSLVLALTGTDPDRLAEAARHTIELGFARLALPDGTVLGVDVRAWRFVRQMIADRRASTWRFFASPPTTASCRRPRAPGRAGASGHTHLCVALTADLVDEWALFMADEVRGRHPARLSRMPISSPCPAAQAPG
ncbi:MAG: hypothetical protein ACLSVD_07355 [Eggerthellaceae bacterium]